jgi:ribonuclease BN (tRNA processing enzyme)
LAAVTVQFLGSGDAFGSGGRFQTCISVRSGQAHVLLDCGASTLIAMKRLGVDPVSVDAIIVTHLHGDHFGGIPFFVLDAQFGHRKKPLLIAGPPGVSERVVRAMEIFFPGSSTAHREFEMRFLELPPRTETAVGEFAVTGYEVVHASGAPAYALRLTRDDKVVTYSGDTEWTEALIEAARRADLFICEAYFFEKLVKNHLALATLRKHRERLDCSRIVLTHMNTDMLARQEEATEELADDGFALIV